MNKGYQIQLNEIDKLLAIPQKTLTYEPHAL